MLADHDERRSGACRAWITSRLLELGRRSARLRDDASPGDEQVDARAAEGRVALDRAGDDRLAGEIERGVEQDRDAAALPEGVAAARGTAAPSRASTACTRAVPSTCVTAASRARHSGRTGNTPDMKRHSRAPPGGSSK